jgi:methylglyoxal synthase
MTMKKNKKIALVAHDNQKKNLLEWVDWNWEILVDHELICTGTTGTLLEELFTAKIKGLKHKKLRLRKLKSGPLGGDQQLGAMIAEGKIDLVIFLWDPMMPQPHEVDVKALLRITVLYNIPTACNRSSADYMISSSLMDSDYKPAPNDFSSYLHRKIVV